MKQSVVKKIEKLSEDLKNVSKVFPEPQRSDWAQDMGLSVSTVNNYLRGKVKNLAIGERLLADIQEYNKKIEKALK